MKKIIADLLAIQTLQLESPEKAAPEVTALREQVPAEMLIRFDKFISRGKKAVALVQNGICKGCQIQVPVGLVNSLIQGAGAPVCGNCGRFLYLLDADAITFQDRNKAPMVVPKAKAPGLTAKTVRPDRKPRVTKLEE